MNCPLCNSNNTFEFHDNVWDSDNSKVYRCHNCDLTFLWPQMSNEEEKNFYKNYNKKAKKRLKKINSNKDFYYQQSKLNAQKRYKIIADFFKNINSVCEIGASVGSFLELLDPNFVKCAVEPNDENRERAKRFSDHQYEYIESLPNDLKFDIICMFHTFEHIKNPNEFLNTCKKHLNENGKLIIEVPHIKDPLVSLYDSKEFKDFYFQKMHPYIYSKKSIKFILEKSGFYTEKFLYSQRYGLSNHLTWLSKGTPGGDTELEGVFNKINNDYKNILENKGITDTIFVVASFEL